jgi:hypothetical protein
MEKWGVALALAFIISGMFVIIHPTEMIVLHPNGGKSGSLHDGGPMLLSKRGSQKFGGFVVALGLGIGFMAFYRGGK